jgi:hypothetical protein
MNSPYPQEHQVKLNNMKVETVEEFLARGGKINKEVDPVNVKTGKIDAQALLDAAIGSPDEAAVIAFLASQGIEVN